MNPPETTALSKLQVHQRPRINLYGTAAVSLSDTWVLSIDGVCESSHSHTNRKLFMDLTTVQKLNKDLMCVTYVGKHLSV